MKNSNLFYFKQEKGTADRPVHSPAGPACRPVMGQRSPVSSPAKAGFTAGQQTEASGLVASWAGPEAGWAPVEIGTEAGFGRLPDRRAREEKKRRRTAPCGATPARPRRRKRERGEGTSCHSRGCSPQCQGRGRGRRGRRDGDKSVRSGARTPGGKTARARSISGVSGRLLLRGGRGFRGGGADVRRFAWGLFNLRHLARQRRRP